MSLMGMRKALGDAIGQAGTREEVDAIVAVLAMVEANFEGRLGSFGNQADVYQSGSQSARSASKTDLRG